MSNIEVDKVKMELGERIRFGRTLSNLTLKELGKKVNLTHQQIVKYEKGISSCTVETLLQLAKALNLNIDFFFSDDWKVTDVSMSISVNEKEDLSTYELDGRCIEFKIIKMLKKCNDINVKKTIHKLLKNVMLDTSE